MRISDWSSDVCSSDLWSWTRRRRGMAEADRPAWQEQTAAPVQEGAPTADAPPASPWRRRMLMFSAPLLLAVVGGYFWLTGGRYVSTDNARSEEHTSELQSLMRISYAVFCLKKKNNKN